MRQDDPAVAPGTFAFSIGCASAYLEQVCERARDDVVPQFAAYLRTNPFNVARALSRYNMIHDELNASICDLSGRGQLQAIAIARKPKKTAEAMKAESNRQHMLRVISNGDGTVFAGGYALAIEQRRAIVEAAGADQRELAGLPTTTTSVVGEAVDAQSTGLKTAGLPPGAGGWTNLTGYEHPVGRVNDLLIDNVGTTTTRTMWAGTDGGGIWKTTNGGTSWSQINDFNGSLSISKVLRSPRNSTDMYASTNPSGSHTYAPFGILKSTDGGTTWNQLPQTNPNTNADFQYVTHLAIHPAGVGGQDILLAATASGAFDNVINQPEGGVYQSVDSGATWTKVSLNIAGTFVAFHPTDGNRRAHSLSDGSITVTTNGNFSGAPTTSIVTGTSRASTKFAFARSNASIMYAIAQSSGNNTTLWRSTSGGSSWSPIALPTNPYPIVYNILGYTGSVWVDPVNPNRIAVAEAWAATTADVTTATASTGWVRASTGWTDFHYIVSDPGYNGSSNKIVYMMDDGGLYRYDDVDAVNDYLTTSVLTTGMTITEAYSVAGRGGNVILGAQDVAPRAYRTDLPDDAASKWRNIESQYGTWFGDGMTTAASRSNPNVLYGSRQYLDIFRSDDGGKSGASICGTAPTNITEGLCDGNFNAPFLAPFALDPANSTTLFAGSRSLWRTQNSTAAAPAWSKVHTLAGNQVTAVAIAPGSSNTVWAAYSNGTLYKSTNAAAGSPTFNLVAATGLPVNPYVLRILIDRTNSQNVWVGLGGSGSARLYFSNNGGATFTPVAGLPQVAVYALAQHPANPAWIYAGTQVGLFASQNSGASWGATNEGPANVVVRDLNWYSESGNSAVLLVATFGRGIWKATVVNSSPTLTVTKLGTGAGTVSSVLPGIACGGDCTETYSGPTSVTLAALADPVNVFTGWLGACTGNALTCTITVTASTSVTATFAPGATMPKVDVDANTPTKYDALTDGLMIVRYLSGIQPLASNAIGPNATRTTDPAILTHLNNIKPLLDVDGNGQVDAQTDGLMILRYLFQLRGNGLTAGAIGVGATRNQSQIETYLSTILQ